MTNWQILDVGSIWLKEFAAALTRRVDTVCWQPEMRWLGQAGFRESETLHANPALTVRTFPLQRGYARFPISAIAPFAPGLIERLKHAVAGDPRESVLVCTTPYYAPVAERWPGAVVYYQTDLTVAYAGVNPRLVRALDQRMCRVAQLVCPNSERIANYFVEEAWCPERKILVIPNATRAANVLEAAPHEPGALPLDAADLPRPIVGVIGNLAANMDWVFLRETIRRTPGFSWLFVGPAAMPVFSRDQADARRNVMAMGGRVRFLGARPYGELQAYARAFDAALLPYRLSEPTYSGSSTRFYEHLAACRPILATRGFAELLKKEPLLELVDHPSHAVAALTRLQAAGFRDGYETARWRASFAGTWEQRVETMLDGVANLTAGAVPIPEPVA
jgi:glycosyltransferase involved in cell wall biosynthesis